MLATAPIYETVKNSCYSKEIVWPLIICAKITSRVFDVRSEGVLRFVRVPEYFQFQLSFYYFDLIICFGFHFPRETGQNIQAAYSAAKAVKLLPDIKMYRYD